MAKIRGTHNMKIIVDDLQNMWKTMYAEDVWRAMDDAQDMWAMYEDIWGGIWDEEDYLEADTLGWPVIVTERQVCATVRLIEHPETLKECWWMPDDEDLDLQWDERDVTRWLLSWHPLAEMHPLAPTRRGS